MVNPVDFFHELSAIWIAKNLLWTAWDDHRMFMFSVVLDMIHYESLPIGSMVLLYMVTWIPSIYPKCQHIYQWVMNQCVSIWINMNQYESMWINMNQYKSWSIFDQKKPVCWLCVFSIYWATCFFWGPLGIVWKKMLLNPIHGISLAKSSPVFHRQTRELSYWCVLRREWRNRMIMDDY